MITSPLRGRRPSTDRTAALLGLVALTLTGCTDPQVCTLVMYEPGVRVDVGALALDPRTADARICLDEECTDAPVTVLLREPAGGPGSPPFTTAPTTARAADPEEAAPARAAPAGAMVFWRRSIPDQERVRVTLVLTDRVSGEELYRGEAAADPEVVEPNGSGCGEVRDLPALTARPDGSLAA